MLKNYFTIALRNLFKNKVYSFINVFGLAIGMAVALMIGLWLNDEISYNTSFENYGQIARVMSTEIFNGEMGTNNAVSIPASTAIKSKYGEDFKKVCMGSWNFGHILFYGDKTLSSQGMWVQPEFKEIFNPEMLEGNSNALIDPSSILISKSLAIALFGSEKGVGKIIKKDNKDNFKVAGVFKDFSYNSEFRDTKLLLPWSKYIQTQPWMKDAITQWGNHSFQLWVLVAKGMDFK